MYGPKWPCLLMYLSHKIDVGTDCSLGRAPRIKETLPYFHEWCQVTRHLRLFRGLKSCQWTLKQISNFLMNNILVIH